jgi:type VI secretion system protein ImpK
MSEERKQAFDPDATVAQPAAKVGADDPEATVVQPIPALPAEDPDATVSGPLAKPQPDPEATVTGPLAGPEADPDATSRLPAFDPDATDRRPAIDPEATVQRPGGPARRVRVNPFAPRAPIETIQANLSSLGGINPLVAIANPVLAAVPQIRRSLKHPDPAGLLNSLREQIEGLEMSAISAEIADDTVSSAVYALCALLDESAASTPWGTGWIDNGLLQAMRGESGGAEGFFAELERAQAEPEKNADLIEFLYICLALGFEGRYRSAEGGREALEQLRARLYGTIARRRPRPEGLSVRWRTPAAQAAADAALETAARAAAARAAAEAAAKAGPSPAAAIPPRFALSRLPRRAIWSAVAGIVGAAIVLYLLAMRLQDDEANRALAARPGSQTSAATASSAGAGPAPARPADAAVPAVAAGVPVVPAAAALARALAGQPVAVTEEAGRVSVAIRHERQFGSGSAQPAAGLAPVLRRIAAALDKLPGAIVVAGHADASPASARVGSNQDLSLARAQAAARLMAPALADPKRLQAEGRGASEPLAPNDSAANRAKNRRVVITLGAAP